MTKLIYVFLGIGILAGIIQMFVAPSISEAPIPGEMKCPEIIKVCPDGSYAQRQGMSCGYECPPEVSEEVKSEINAKADLIKLRAPIPNEVIISPLHIAGSARGNWFFEGSFPVSLVNWDGLIIAEGIATAEGEWMTNEFVPFSATLEYTSPYKEGDQDFMKRGALILQKDNPSGLPEHDNALEIPVRFSE